MNKKRKIWTALVLRLGISAAVFAILFLFLLTVRIVHGNEMGEAIRDGQMVLISRTARIYSDSVVLFRDSGKEEHLGRVTGFDDREDLFFLTAEEEKKSTVRQEDIIGTVIFAVQYRDF